MSTPNPVVLNVYDGTTDAPYAGVAGSLSFVAYVDDTGTPVTPPAITKVANGIFIFTPVFSGHGIYYIVSTGQAPLYLAGYVRPEDTASADSVSTILSTVQQMQKAEQGKWAIVTSGPDANRLVIFDTDGTTPLLKFNLFDAAGSPTVASIFSRVPV